MFKPLTLHLRFYFPLDVAKNPKRIQHGKWFHILHFPWSLCNSSNINCPKHSSRIELQLKSKIGKHQVGSRNVQPLPKDK